MYGSFFIHITILSLFNTMLSLHCLSSCLLLYPPLSLSLCPHSLSIIIILFPQPLSVKIHSLQSLGLSCGLIFGRFYTLLFQPTCSDSVLYAQHFGHRTTDPSSDALLFEPEYSS